MRELLNDNVLLSVSELHLLLHRDGEHAVFALRHHRVHVGQFGDHKRVVIVRSLRILIGLLSLSLRSLAIRRYIHVVALRLKINTLLLHSGKVDFSVEGLGQFLHFHSAKTMDVAALDGRKIGLQLVGDIEEAVLDILHSLLHRVQERVLDAVGCEVVAVVVLYVVEEVADEAEAKVDEEYVGELGSECCSDGNAQHQSRNHRPPGQSETACIRI